MSGSVGNSQSLQWTSNEQPRSQIQMPTGGKACQTLGPGGSTRFFVKVLGLWDAAGFVHTLVRSIRGSFSCLPHHWERFLLADQFLNITEFFRVIIVSPLTYMVKGSQCKA